MYYGQGFTHSDVYNMPVYLRNFYYKQLAETRKKENDEVKKVNQKSKSRVAKPAINPKSYMNSSSILTEGAINAFLKGLFKGREGLKRDAVRAKVKLEKSIDKFNDNQSDLEKEIEKVWGKKVKLPRQTFDDVVKKAR